MMTRPIRNISKAHLAFNIEKIEDFKVEKCDAMSNNLQLSNKYNLESKGRDTTRALYTRTYTREQKNRLGRHICSRKSLETKLKANIFFS
ncbi:unnamed protein product, partial [Brenthis ino]